PTTLRSTPALHDALPISVACPGIPAYGSPPAGPDYSRTRVRAGFFHTRAPASFAQGKPNYRGDISKGCPSFVRCWRGSRAFGDLDRKSTRMNSSHEWISY